MAGISGTSSGKRSSSKRKSSSSSSSSPKKALAKMKRNNFNSNSRSIKKTLQSYVLDDEALKHRIRHLESQKEKLDHRIIYLDEKVDGHRKREAGLLQTTAKSLRDLKHCEKSKNKLESEVRKLTFKMSCVKKKLCKLEGEKSKLERQLSSSGLFNDMLNNFKELFETNLQCSICSEIFLFATVISCGHTFCEDCIEEWTSKKNNCPICRANIKGKASNVVLDEHVEKMVEQFFPEGDKKTRKALILERKNKKMSRVASSIKVEDEEDSSDEASSDSDEEEDFRLPRLGSLSPEVYDEGNFVIRDHPIMSVTFDSSSDDDSYSPLRPIQENSGPSSDSGSSSSSTEEGFTTSSEDEDSSSDE